MKGQRCRSALRCRSHRLHRAFPRLEGIWLTGQGLPIFARLVRPRLHVPPDNGYSASGYHSVECCFCAKCLTYGSSSFQDSATEPLSSSPFTLKSSSATDGMAFSPRFLKPLWPLSWGSFLFSLSRHSLGDLTPAHSFFSPESLLLRRNSSRLQTLPYGTLVPGPSLSHLPLQFVSFTFEDTCVLACSFLRVVMSSLRKRQDSSVKCS